MKSRLKATGLGIAIITVTDNRCFRPSQLRHRLRLLHRRLERQGFEVVESSYAYEFDIQNEEKRKLRQDSHLLAEKVFEALGSLPDNLKRPTPPLRPR
jgi:hypothetical protein